MLSQLADDLFDADLDQGPADYNLVWLVWLNKIQDWTQADVQGGSKEALANYTKEPRS